MILPWIVLSLPLHRVAAVETGGCYIKTFYTHFESTEVFDETGSRVRRNTGAGEDLKNTFDTILLEVRYGMSDRVSAGVQPQWVRSADSPGDSRGRVTDLWLLVEYYLAGYPQTFSLLGSGKIPLGYDESIGAGPYLGNGSSELKLSLKYKGFFRRGRWIFEAIGGPQKALENTGRLSNKSIEIPLWLNLEHAIGSGTNLYATLLSDLFHIEWFGGFQYSKSEGYYLAPGLGLKFVPFRRVEIDVGGSYWAAGQNTSAGFSLGLGIAYGVEDLAE